MVVAVLPARMDPRLACRPVRHHLVDAREEVRVADAEILVRDAKAAREERERELQRIEMPVPLRRLEPLEARLRGPLQ